VLKRRAPLKPSKLANISHRLAANILPFAHIEATKGAVQCLILTGMSEAERSN
jgi:hypothetical protein